MTDRMRFENKAIQSGATVTVSESTFLQVVSVNGEVITNYFFDNEGKFVNFSNVKS